MEVFSKYDVVQANENSEEWCGCLFVVDDVKKDKLLCCMKIPNKGLAYVYFTEEQVFRIGKAEIIFDT